MQVINAKILAVVRRIATRETFRLDNAKPPYVGFPHSNSVDGSLPLGLSIFDSTQRDRVRH